MHIYYTQNGAQTGWPKCNLLGYSACHIVLYQTKTLLNTGPRCWGSLGTHYVLLSDGQLFCKVWMRCVVKSQKSLLWFSKICAREALRWIKNACYVVLALDKLPSIKLGTSTIAFCGFPSQTLVIDRLTNMINSNKDEVEEWSLCLSLVVECTLQICDNWFESSKIVIWFTGTEKCLKHQEMTIIIFPYPVIIVS